MSARVVRPYRHSLSYPTLGTSIRYSQLSAAAARLIHQSLIPCTLPTKVKFRAVPGDCRQADRQRAPPSPPSPVPSPQVSGVAAASRGHQGQDRVTPGVAD
ncbi:hypothetical protein M8818_003056 [Zalaria obscura]|uniref:Uncharacterized protein n=1 Tax=Zalaria obscura TaxID=2024903 RepID=A0ACC3SGF2_9PEZI